MEGEALATLVVNKLRGPLQVAAVKTPGFGDQRESVLQSMALLTGGKVITEGFNIQLSTIQISDLGQARKIIIDKDNTIIIEGAGNHGDVAGRVGEIHRQGKTTTSNYDGQNAALLG